jgi:hypothetical protein
MIIPSPDEVIAGFQAFQMHERRDAMYKTATFLVEHFWGDSTRVADSLGVLLLTWNQAFYRYGYFDFDLLERCIRENQELLNYYRSRDIVTATLEDDTYIKQLFDTFMIALQIQGGKKHGARSPVSASKALHLLAPAFFPLYDDKIARAYNYNHLYRPLETYVLFLKDMQVIAQKLQEHMKVEVRDKTLLKLIDEYNYAKYTKHWI